MDLVKRLNKCCCKSVRYHCEPGKWYKLEMIYNKKYYRFFALSFEELEMESLREMRKINRDFEMINIIRGVIYG